MEEIWKDVIGYEGHYQVSNCGNVRSVDRVIKIGCKKSFAQVFRGKLLKPSVKSAGYAFVNLRNVNKQSVSKTAMIHRLVALAFIPNPENKPLVNHIDHNKLNNNVSNLEWVNNSENLCHHQREMKKRNTKSVSPKNLIEALSLFQSGHRNVDIQKILGLNKVQVQGIKKKYFSSLPEKEKERMLARRKKQISAPPKY